MTFDESETPRSHTARRSAVDRVALLAKMAWASPWSAFGLLVGMATLATGGRAALHGRVLEFHGGAARWLLRHAIFVRGAAAMTLGHVVLGQTAGDLDRCRAHELAHVRQYERWGPAFVPAYLASSIIAWARGRHYYLHNAFEIDAYGEEDSLESRAEESY